MPMKIDSAFPGGNIVVEHTDGDSVYLHQDLRDTAIDWFYWCFRVSGAAGRTLRFCFTRSQAIGVRGPAASLDEGATWAWLGRDTVQGNSFAYAYPQDVSTVRLSFAMPYQESHWQQFMAEAGSHPSVIQDALCVTPKGRNVGYAILRCEQTPEHRVAITCRHHCCEMMANYVLEGLVRWILQDADAEALRRNVEFFLVPFVDKDGVEGGDQGKGRQPRDHGRDYAGESIYAETKAIREQLPTWGRGRLRVGLDLHCPYISGPHNEVIYLVGSSDDRISREQRRFCRMLESSIRGPLPFCAGDFLPFGEAWNTAQNYTGGLGFAAWFARLPGVALGTAIEVPYATAKGVAVNPASAHAFGADLGRGLATYLRTI